MRSYRATFEDVNRCVFDNLSNRIEEDSNLFAHINVYYNGTNISGDLRIEGIVGYSDDFKRALQIFNEEYCNS